MDVLIMGMQKQLKCGGNTSPRSGYGICHKIGIPARYKTHHCAKFREKSNFTIVIVLTKWKRETDGIL